MAQISSSFASTTEPQQADRIKGTASPPEVAVLLAKVDKFLQAQDPQQALALLSRAKLAASPWTQNAIGVCQLRLGQTQAAVSMFRSIVMSESLLMRQDVLTACKTNYATALLLAKNISGCQAVLADLNEEDHPTVPKLKAAIRRWKSNLTLWQKLPWYTGSDLDYPIELDFPPGDLD